MAYAGAVFICVTFVVLARALGIFTKPLEVAATSRRAFQALSDPALDDDAKERSMRAHTKTLGRLFVAITTGAIVAVGLPLTIVWLLDAAGWLSFSAVLDALVSWPLVLGGVTAFLAKAGYDRVWRRGTL